MATNIETMWVGDPEQLQRTVQNLVTRGGVVQAQSDTEVSIYIKKKINIPVLVVGLILCLVPGLAYLAWYLTADQNQNVTVKVGAPDTIKTDHQHWYDTDGIPPASEAAEATGATTPAPPGLGTADPSTAIPPLPTAAPEAAPAVPPPPPAPPAPPSGGTSF